MEQTVCGVGCNRQVEYVDKRHCSLNNVPGKIRFNYKNKCSEEQLMIREPILKGMKKYFYLCHFFLLYTSYLKENPKVQIRP